MPDDDQQPEILSWQKHIEGLVIGALRGMMEAQYALDRAMDGAVPPINDLAMFQATEILAATFLEDSAGCVDDASLEEASRKVGNDVLDHLQALRKQREAGGTSPLQMILDHAGITRSQTH